MSPEGNIVLTTPDRNGAALRITVSDQNWTLQRFEKENRRGPQKWVDRGHYLSRDMLATDAGRHTTTGRLSRTDSVRIDELPRMHPAYRPTST